MADRPNCSKHKTIEEVFGMRPEQLAEKIGNLRYDQLTLFFKHLALKIWRDGQRDAGRGRASLAIALAGLSTALKDARRRAAEVWKISKPYMK